MNRRKGSQLQQRVVLLGLALAGVAPALRAQQAGQFEVGAFGSYTRYDKAFGLDNRAGGGARLGYFFGKVVGLEAEVLFQPNYTVSTGGAATTLEPLIASGSLVFNALRGTRVTLYALGGYSLRNSSKQIRLLSVPYVICLFQWATIVAFFRFVTGRQSVQWDGGSSQRGQSRLLSGSGSVPQH